ncbi:hypothetical protein LLG96_13835 [bacterium]|nr:hypothetical protein [bacterium]
MYEEIQKEITELERAMNRLTRIYEARLEWRAGAFLMNESLRRSTKYNSPLKSL